MRAAAVCVSLICLLTLQFVLVHGGTISSDPDDFRRMTSVHRKKCIVESKTTLEAIEGTEYGEFPEDENLKCYFKCVLEKFNMIDKNGKIRYNILKQVIPNVYKEIGNEMVDSCKDVGKYSIDCNDREFICYRSIILIIIFFRRRR
ncbi:odorant binding protein 11 isoform X1 [Bombus vancouverensis nearcticus]|uniref:general odorant-binding protein 83a-like isoform X1 n=1 Tax=Bombus huntii TaxID=85661 RepID=UPI0021AAE78F|nr:general odorant-binding protein 83a-like isoform X1 [Bombus huntii]